MYESFYGLREKPFSIAPDPAFLFMSRKHRRALVMLEYGLVNHIGFSVITGEIGSGKTTLLRKLLQRLDQSVSVGLVSNTQCDSFEELLRWIMLSFELEYNGLEKVALYHAFTDFLVREYSRNRRVVLIVDEAQHLGPAQLEQLRMLSNVNADKHQLLQLILVGQPELLALLRQPQLEQFAQRIGVDYHLQPLDPDETRLYVRHRLEVAGGSQELFGPGTYELIWSKTRGVPRLINLLCDMALVYAYAEQKPTVDNDLMRDVIRDKEQGLAPLVRDENDARWRLAEGR